jgi:hypothetical protein
MNNFNLIRNSLLVFTLLLCALWWYRSTSPSPALASPQAPAATASILKNHQEVRAYMKAKVAEPIPAGYDIPDYITKGLTKDQVYDTFALRYPQFYGYGSTQLLDSIAKNPLLYDKMITENKAIRRYYDPNSKY